MSIQITPRSQSKFSQVSRHHVQIAWPNPEVDILKAQAGWIWTSWSWNMTFERLWTLGPGIHMWNIEKLPSQTFIAAQRSVAGHFAMEKVLSWRQNSSAVPRKSKTHHTYPHLSCGVENCWSDPPVALDPLCLIVTVHPTCFVLQEKHKHK